MVGGAGIPYEYMSVISLESGNRIVGKIVCFIGVEKGFIENIRGVVSDSLFLNRNKIW